MRRRVFVSVFGGVVQGVIVPPLIDGTWTGYIRAGCTKSVASATRRSRMGEP
jgi:hypothetical protein